MKFTSLLFSLSLVFGIQSLASEVTVIGPFTLPSSQKNNGTNVSLSAVQAKVPFPANKYCYKITEDVYDCADGLFIDFYDIELQPAKPKRGDKFTLFLSGKTQVIIENETTLDSVVSLDVYTVDRYTQPLCDNISRKPATCPMPKGYLFETYKQYELSYGLPDGEYHINTKGYDKNGKEIFWVQFRIVL